MATLARMQVDLIANTAAFKKDMTSAGRTFTKVGKSMTAAGKTLTTRLTAPILGVGAAMFKMAADAGEASSQLDAVFGRSAGAMNQSIRELRETIPATTKELQSFAAGFGDTFIPMGASAAMAREMSTEVLKLAGDLASFKNVPITQALMDMQSGFAGQFEPLRKYAAFLSVAKVKAEALRLGLVKTGEEVSELARAQAVTSLVTKASALALGDAANTAGSAANQLKFLWSDVRELAAVFGERLLPVITPVIQKLRDVVSWVKNLSIEKQVLIITVGAAVAAIGPLVVVAGTLVTSIGAIMPVVGAVIAGLGTFGAAFLALNPIVLGVIAVVGGLIAAWVKWGKEAPRVVIGGVKKIAERFEWLTGPIVNLVKSLGAMTLEWVALLIDLSVATVRIVSGISKDIVHWLVDALRPLAKWMWENVLRPMLTIFTKVANKVSGWASGIVGFFNRMRGKVRDEEVAPMAEEVEGIFEGMGSAVTSLMGRTKDSVIGTMAAMRQQTVSQATKLKDDVVFEMVDLSETMPVVLKTGTDKVEKEMDTWAGSIKTKTQLAVAGMGEEWARIGEVVFGDKFDTDLLDALRKWHRFAQDVVAVLRNLLAALGGDLGDLGDVFRGAGTSGNPNPGGGVLGGIPDVNVGGTQPPIGGVNPGRTGLVAPDSAGSVVIHQHFNGSVDAATVRDASAEGVDIGLGRLQRVATRVHAGDMAVVV